LALVGQHLGAASLRDGRDKALIADLAPPGGALGDYVSGTSGEGELQVRIRCQSPGSFSSSGDLLRIAYDKPTG